MPEELPETPYPELRDHLLEHSVRRGDFVLKSGLRSSWFIDSKQTVCRPEAMEALADAVLSVIPPEATAIGGLTMGADPVAFITAGVAATKGRSLRAFSVRKETKDHGGGGRIAGALEAGDKVVVTEDTVSRVGRRCSKRPTPLWRRALSPCFWWLWLIEVAQPGPWRRPKVFAFKPS